MSYSHQELTSPGQLFFVATSICHLIIQCRTLPHLQPPCTDLFPIATTVNISMAQSPDLPKLNWQQVNWSNFCEHLTLLLNGLPTPAEIQSLEEFNDKLTSLIIVINTVIATTVPCTNPSLFTKRWWTKELSQACSRMRQVARLANKVHNNPSHPCHRDYCLQCNAYTGLIQSTKKKHWIG